MHNVSVPLNALRAVALFAGKQDIRYYLNGVHVSSFRGKLTLAATDGHRLTIFHDRETEYDGPEFIIPIHIVTDFKPERIFTNVEISFSPEGVTVTLAAGGITITGKPVDGKFPDWQRVIPRKYSGKFSSAVKDVPYYHGANVDYLATYAKMQKLLGARWPMITIAPNGADTMLIDVGDTRFLCVLMPANSSQPKLPEWYTAPHLAPEVDTHVTGDGKKFTTFKAAWAHAQSVSNETGAVISVEEIKPEAVPA